TLPHELNPLAQSHPRLVYRLLFQATASTLTRFGRDPRYLGGALGVTAVLHTWGQTLTQHVHVHCVVTGGALAPDRSRWIPARPGFLIAEQTEVADADEAVGDDVEQDATEELVDLEVHVRD